MKTKFFCLTGGGPVSIIPKSRTGVAKPVVVTARLPQPMGRGKNLSRSSRRSRDGVEERDARARPHDGTPGARLEAGRPRPQKDQGGTCLHGCTEDEG